jgi:hypothetical protein
VVSGRSFIAPYYRSRGASAMRVRSVIPGRREAANPKAMNTGLWNMDSGLAGWRPRPGMTPEGQRDRDR